MSPEGGRRNAIDEETGPAASGKGDSLLHTVDGFAAAFSAFACPAEFPCRGPSIGVGRVDFAGRRGQGGCYQSKNTGEWK
jgi:hypothetical protein